MSAIARLPTAELDLFDDDALTNPYEHYAAMRAQGPAVRIERHGVVAFPRYAEVRAALVNWKTFSSADGVGLSPRLNKYYEGSVLASDPPLHDQLRKVLADSLSPKAIRALTDDIESRADALIASLVDRGSFDAITDLAQVFPVSVVADLVGLPSDERDKLLERADGSFNVFGPDNKRARDSEYVFGDTFKYITTCGARNRLTPGSFGASLFDAADKGQIDIQQVIPLMLAYLFAGMDTTVNAIGHAVWLLASHPAQWALLKADPGLIPAAFEEILRFESPVQYFTRVAHQDHEIEGFPIKEGERVLLMFGSANRDERKWHDADQFNIRRNPQHVSFGIGTHNCVGQTLARLEAHSLLASMLTRIESWELGKPVPHLNNVLRGLAHLPVSTR